CGAALWLIYFLFYTKTGLKLTHTNIKDLSVYLKSFGGYAIFIGIAAILVQTFIPFIPFMLIAGGNVLVFGLVYGFMINYIMSCLAGLFPSSHLPVLIWGLLYRESACLSFWRQHF